MGRMKLTGEQLQYLSAIDTRFPMSAPDGFVESDILPGDVGSGWGPQRCTRVFAELRHMGCIVRVPDSPLHTIPAAVRLEMNRHATKLRQRGSALRRVCTWVQSKINW